MCHFQSRLMGDNVSFHISWEMMYHLQLCFLMNGTLLGRERHLAGDDTSSQFSSLGGDGSSPITIEGR